MLERQWMRLAGVLYLSTYGQVDYTKPVGTNYKEYNFRTTGRAKVRATINTIALTDVLWVALHALMLRYSQYWNFRVVAFPAPSVLMAFPIRSIHSTWPMCNSFAQSSATNCFFVPLHCKPLLDQVRAQTTLSCWFGGQEKKMTCTNKSSHATLYVVPLIVREILVNWMESYVHMWNCKHSTKLHKWNTARHTKNIQ